MAQHQSESRPYKHCLIKPLMSEDGKPKIHLEHVIDAVIVGAIAFFSVLGAQVVPSMFLQQGIYLTPQDIVVRLPTAAVGFFLTFFFQWGRARGLAVRQLLLGEQ